MSIRTRSNRSRRHRRALLAACALVLTIATSRASRAEDDPMAPYRERFQSGMTHYKAGDFAGAVAWWEPIVSALGDEKGYRVAFDLARAYEKLGDTKHARARYDAFVHAVEARRARGEAIDPIVEKEEGEARASLEPTPTATPPATSPPVATTPAATSTPASPAPPPAATAPAAAIAPPAPPPAPETRASTPPFSPWILVAGTALTASAGIVCGVEYANALGKKSDFEAAAGQPGAQATIKTSYDGVRSVAYVSLAVTAGLAAITGGLAAWYFAASGNGRENSPVTVTAAPIARGGQVGLAGRF